VVNDAIRTCFSFFDRGPYLILKYIYQLFFNVASAEVISGATIMSFFSRVQLIIGVFMMFQLAMSILKGIMNPDSFVDGKTGFGNIISRIVTALVLLTLLVPINIPSPRNEYEKQINNNGLLFGTLYSLQNRLLTNNTLGRLILGVSDDSHNYTSWDNDDEELETASNIFASTILKGFYRINLIPEDERTHEDGKEDYMINDNRVCQDIDDSVMEEYSKIDADPQIIISMVNETCNAGEVWEDIPVIDAFTDNEKYVFVYIPILPAIVAIVFVFVLLDFTIKIAVRAVKLAILRLIAPIPIISYMDPKGGKDGAFSAWVKTLTSTYIDLFLRLGIIYFILYLIESMMINGIVVPNGTGMLGFFSKLAIWIGLIVFARESPAFIKKALGLKGDFKLFGGITEALGVGAMGLGAVSGAVSGATSKYQNTSGSTGKKIAASILGGLGGGIGGGINSGKAFFGGKEINPNGIMEANRKYATQRYANAADDSTFGGRMLAGFQSNIGRQNELQKLDEKIKYFGATKDALGRMNDAFNSNGDYKKAFAGTGVGDGHLRDANGNIVLEAGKNYSLKDYNDILGHVQASGDQTLIDAVDSAKKAAQGERLKHLRTTFTGKDRVEARNKLIEQIEIEAQKEKTEKAAGRTYTKKYNQRDLDVFDGAYTIYNVSQKFEDEPFFTPFNGKKFDDKDLTWTVFKTGASTAGDTAKSIKASPEYDRASSNAQRVKESQKK
jgi:hypothetical protein